MNRLGLRHLAALDNAGRVTGVISARDLLRSRMSGPVALGDAIDTAPDSVALGRAWRPTRDFPDGRYGDPGVVGAAYFLDCWIDAHVGEPAWDPMAYTARDGSRVMLEPRDARFGEWRSRGPGALRSAARPQLDAAARHAAAAEQMFGDCRPGDA